MMNLDCDTAQTWITIDLDEGLDASKHTLLERHLQHCDVCRETRAATVLLLRDFSEDVPPDPGEDFWARYETSLNAQLREKTPRRSYFRQFRWPAVAVLVPATLAILMLSVSPVQERGVERWSCGVTTYAPVIEELRQLYGPIPEETSIGDLSKKYTTLSVYSKTADADEDLMRRLGVEDEPGFPLF